MDGMAEVPQSELQALADEIAPLFDEQFEALKEAKAHLPPGVWAKLRNASVRLHHRLRDEAEKRGVILPRSGGGDKEPQ